LAKAANKERVYLSQADVPGCSLDKALRIARAIADNYGHKPSTPVEVASAMNVTPSSGPFRMITGASIAYGLTSGGSNAETISITPLGLRIVRITDEGDDTLAKREALLRPRVIREFLQKYDGAAIPRDDIAKNVLVTFGVPKEKADEVLHLIVDGAESVGFLRTIKDKKYVNLAGSLSAVSASRAEDNSEEKAEEIGGANSGAVTPPPFAVAKSPSSVAADARLKKVFITHGKNKGFIEPIRKLLSFGELEAVVAAERSTVSQPVPEKVMEDMRSCGAAIIHVDDERRLLDTAGAEHVVINENVLIEIGAAMALYGRRFVLIVKDGVKLPSNLQGLFEVRYQGDGLDVNATVRLLEVINDMKKRPLP
jgi:predicted nucleotide-binding protein with TIR-like domain